MYCGAAGDLQVYVRLLALAHFKDAQSRIQITRLLEIS